MMFWSEIPPLDREEPLGQRPTGTEGRPEYLLGQRLAPWGLRAVAIAIDWTIAGVAAEIITAIFFQGADAILWWWWIWGALCVFYPSDSLAQSPGKHLCKLTVVVPRVDPRDATIYWACKPSTGRMVARHFLHGLDFLTIGFGFLRAGWGWRQTYADRCVGTFVFWRWPHDTHALIPDEPTWPRVH